MALGNTNSSRLYNGRPFWFHVHFRLQFDILRKALYINYLFSYDVMINTLKQHYKLYLVGDVTSFDTFLVDMRDKYNSNMKMWMTAHK